jgi:leader peptidase (prepilin peptidase)/N-methyltransferase
VPTLVEIPGWFVVAIAVSLGLAFGSFINVVIYRLPRGMSVVRPASACPNCDEPIRFFDNIPLFSWLFLRGRARCCKSRIAWRYPMLEVLAGLLGWAIVETQLSQLPALTPWYVALGVFCLYLALGLGLLAASFIDLDYMYIPDAITLGGALLGLLSAGVRGDVTYVESLIGASVGFLMIWLPFDVLYRKLRGRTGMAMGDAKLVMLAGAWFGLGGAVFALLAGAVQGTVMALASFAAKGSLAEPEAVRQERQAMLDAIDAAEGAERQALVEEFEKDPIAHEPEPGLAGARLAFGPFLALATTEYMLFGPALLRDYLGIWL